MKVLVAVFLVISSVTARGSGPYLPSGWRPDGPAFKLPTEEAQAIPRTAQEPLVEETEASGSDALREYGPPKLEVFLNANQGLPDVATDPTPFQSPKSDEVVSDVQEAVNIEGNTEQGTESNDAEAIKPEEDEPATLSDVQTTAGSPAIDAVNQEEVSADIPQTKESNEPEQNDVPVVLEDSVIATAVAEEVAVPLYQQELQQDAVPTVGSAIVVDQELVPEAVPTTSPEAVANVAQQEQEVAQDAVSVPAEEVVTGREAVGINDIADAIVSLEKEVKAIEIQANDNIADVTPTQAISGTLEQSREGFLEYGPPGFLEYGPPNQQLLRVPAAEETGAGALQNNEVRRRRYSLKFGLPKKH